LIGARQAQFILSQAPAIVAPGEIIAVRERPAPLPARLTAEAEAAHRRFIASLGENAIWRDYVSLG
jgi:DNA polymerase-3 subunit epsilon